MGKAFRGNIGGENGREEMTVGFPKAPHFDLSQFPNRARPTADAKEMSSAD